MLYFTKIFVSALIILIASELSRKSTVVASLVIAVPIVSILSLSWLWIETHDIEKISKMSYEIFLFVIPSLPIFLIIPFLLKRGFGFFPSMFIGCIITAILFAIMKKLFISLN